PAPRRHEVGHAARVAHETACLRWLQQHDADDRERDNQVDNENDSFHGKSFNYGNKCPSTLFLGLNREKIQRIYSSPLACAMDQNSSAFRLAPPTRTPSTLGRCKISPALPGLTEPP